jgi:O-antigen ligase
MITFPLLLIYAYAVLGLILKPRLLLFTFPLLAFFDNTRLLVVSPSEVAQIGIIAIVFASGMGDGSTSIRELIPKFAVVVILYFAWIFFDLLFHLLAGSDIPFFDMLKDTMKAVLGFFFVLSCRSFIRTERDLQIITRFLLIGFVCAISAALAYMIIKGDPMALRANQDVLLATEGVNGTILKNPNHYSRYLYFAFPFLIAALRISTPKVRATIYTLMIVASITILTTVSRMAFLMMIMILMVTAFAYGKWRIIVFGVFALALTTVLLGGVTEKMEERFSRLQDVEDQNRIVMLAFSLHLIGDNPVFGTGPGSFNRLMLQSGLFGSLPDTGKAAHNNFLFLAVQFGIAASVMMALILFLLVWWFWRRRRNGYGMNHFSLAGFTTVLAFSGAGMTALVMGSDQFWFLLAVLYATQSKSFLDAPRQRQASKLQVETGPNIVPGQTGAVEWAV